MPRTEKNNALLSILSGISSSSSSSRSSSVSSSLISSGSSRSHSRSVSSISHATEKRPYFEQLARILQSSEELSLRPVSSSELLADLFVNYLRPNEEEVDDAFKGGTRLISDLLSENKIDDETARKIISCLVELYTQQKVDWAIRKFLSKRKSEHWAGLLRLYLEEKW